MPKDNNAAIARLSDALERGITEGDFSEVEKLNVDQRTWRGLLERSEFHDLLMALLVQIALGFRSLPHKQMRAFMRLMRLTKLTTNHPAESSERLEPIIFKLKDSLS